MAVEHSSVIERVVELLDPVVAEEPADRDGEPIGQQMGVAVDDHGAQLSRPAQPDTCQRVAAKKVRNWVWNAWLYSS